MIGVLGIDLLLGGIRVQKREEFLELIEKFLGPKVPISAKGRRKKRLDIGVSKFLKFAKSF